MQIAGTTGVGVGCGEQLQLVDTAAIVPIAVIPIVGINNAFNNFIFL